MVSFRGPERVRPFWTGCRRAAIGPDTGNRHHNPTARERARFVLLARRIGRTGGPSMPSRRPFLLLCCSALAAGLLPGCAGPLSGVPRFSWGQTVEVRGVRFDFNAVRIVDSSRLPLIRPVAASGPLLVVDVTMTNRRGEAIAPQLQPQFRLLDADRGMYAPGGLVITEGSRLPTGSAALPPAIEADVPMRQQLYFDVPAQAYTLLVAVPSGKALRSLASNSSTPLGDYFLYDISSQLSWR